MTSNSRVARKRQKGKPKKPIWKKILLTITALILLCGIAVGAVFGYFIATAPKLDPEKLDVPYSAQFYDKDGEEFADIGTENRIKIKYDDLPQELIDAVTATEDVRFFEHKGIDLRRIAGAVKANIQRGFGAEGASTITQQVVEQMFLTPEKSIKLKVQEQWLALKLEREYSKEEILEMYLNKIFYGSNAFGVAKASEIYFGKEDLHDLTLLESAMLAGLPQRPTAYNPFENPDLMQERVQTVLKLMVRHGKISQEEADEANAIDVASVLTDKKPSTTPYDAFVQKVNDELNEKLEDVDVFSSGVKVYTTLDTKAQDKVESLLTDSEDNPIAYPDDELRAGMVVLDTKTGEIRAIGGGRNRESGDLNYAYKAPRQPGSVFKPIMDYGPAIEYNQYSTYHQINDDKPYDYGGDNPVRNWNRQYQGWMSMRKALKESLNVPALKTLEDVGIDKGKEFAEGLGITFGDEPLGITEAIGGSKTNTSPLDIAGAYSAFGNEGIYTEPYSVTKVEFPDGSVVDLRPESEVAMSDYTAYMITDMLKSVVQSGTGTNANISSLPMAGKTGTTNISGKSGANNSWFSGYTTNYTIAVWTGYDEHDRIIENTQIPHALFKQTMEEISKDTETEDFTKPSSVVEVAVEKGSNPAALPSEFTPKDDIVTELFVKGTEPTSTSEKFDELEPVQNLAASYEEEKSEINVTWDYENDEDMEFAVSYKVGDGGMKELTTTGDKEVTISSIEEDATYTIQVVAIKKDTDMKSEPATTTVEINQKDISAVKDLHASYDEDSQSLQITWNYDNADASFELDINGQTQTVNSTSIQINNVSPGNTYKITVTPVIDGKRGDSSSTSITIEEKDSGDQDQSDDNNNDQGENPDEDQQPENPDQPSNEDEDNGQENSDPEEE